MTNKHKMFDKHKMYIRKNENRVEFWSFCYRIIALWMSYYFYQKYEKPRKKIGNETVTVTSYWKLIRDNAHIILARKQPVLALSSIIVIIMPARCVVGGCSNVPNAEQGIALHFIPLIDDVWPEAKRRRRRQWIRFVNVRAKWNPTKYSGICSAHFANEDF